jgi:hypothetical protein
MRRVEERVPVCQRIAVPQGRGGMECFFKREAPVVPDAVRSIFKLEASLPEIRREIAMFRAA